MARVIHPIAGAVALVTILIFWISTVVSELSGSAQAVVVVKTAIPWGFLLLAPTLAIAGASGFARAKSRPGGLSEVKRLRMPFIAANGVMILVPCALYLSSAARAGAFDSLFYSVQILELIAGSVNIVLLGLNMRDGLQMTGRLRPRFISG